MTGYVAKEDCNNKVPMLLHPIAIYQNEVNLKIRMSTSALAKVDQDKRKNLSGPSPLRWSFGNPGGVTKRTAAPGALGKLPSGFKIARHDKCEPPLHQLGHTK